MMDQIQTAGDLRAKDLSQSAQSLAESIARIHGTVYAARESGGLQLYFACPNCLQLEGPRALRTKKFSINADRYFIKDKWRRQRGTYNVERSASCLKCEAVYTVSELLLMPPLAERGYPAEGKEVIVGALTRKLVPDEFGVLVPPGPGTVIPIPDCPPDNPGRWYLEHRGYDIMSLWRQFEVCWCERELPRNEQLAIFYRNLPLGFRSTPQGRVIFYARRERSAITWQGRIPEYTEGRHKYYWHPYERRWVLCEILNNANVWEPIPAILASPLDWEDMPKYRTAKHTSRAEVVMGFDAAIAWNNEHGRTTRHDRVAFLTEGPLDAGRLAPPAIAALGSFISLQQAQFLTSNFRKVVFFPDKGKAGEKSIVKAQEHMSAHCDLEIVEDLPTDDPGGLSPAWVRHYREKYLI